MWDCAESLAGWPELRVDVVVGDPEVASRVLVIVRWPADPDAHVLLMLELHDAPDRARRMLVHWRDSRAQLTPLLLPDEQLVLRKRRTNDVLCARVVTTGS